VYTVENKRTGETNNEYMTKFGKNVGESYDDTNYHR
jgi:hypothetical protein